MSIKKFFKRNTRNLVLKSLSRFGLSINRLYENKNYDIDSNGELNVLEVLKEINPNVIVDAGANRGDYTLKARAIHPDTKIWAFEPVEEPFQQLQKVASKDPSISLLQMGLGKDSGRQTIHLYDSDEHSSLVNIDGMGRIIRDRIEVEIVSGDDFMKQNQIDTIDLLKIDVEGAEMEVIKGFTTAFSNKKIKACQFEYGYANITSHALLFDFYDFFSKLGYRVGKIYPKYVEFRDYDVRQEDFLGPNYLAVDETQIDVIRKLSK